jgi:hypothetical protein
VGAHDRLDRRPLAIAVTADGRRVHMAFDADKATPLSLLRSILVVIESLVGLLIGDSRRENGGTRRIER